MRKYLYRLVSLFLVITHLVVFCGKDLVFAAENSVKGTSKQVSGNSKTASLKSVDSSDGAAQTKASKEIKPPDKGSKPKDSVGWMPQTRSVGLNLSVLQSFQNDPFTGRGSFSIPIDIPGGRKGIQPNVSLLYASGQANGIAGVGWSLELVAHLTQGNA